MKKLLKKITPLYKLYLFLYHSRTKLYNYLVIPSYEVKRNTIITIAKKYNALNVFLETGTYMGDTVEYLKNNFSKLISIELNEDLAVKAKKRFAAENKIQIVQGDSAKELSAILAPISMPVVFWLDGHYSSEFWAGGVYIVTAKGDKETPILEELGHIARHPVKNHIILIDDARLFKGEHDYPHMNELNGFVKSNFPNHKLHVAKDIIRILPLGNK